MVKVIPEKHIRQDEDWGWTGGMSSSRHPSSGGFKVCTQQGYCRLTVFHELDANHRKLQIKKSRDVPWMFLFTQIDVGLLWINGWSTYPLSSLKENWQVWWGCRVGGGDK